MINQINSERALRGLPPLRPNEQLAAAAQGHAEDMAAHRGMVHTGSDGSDGGERIRAAGYDWVQWGEVVAWGWEGDENRAVTWWLASADHSPYLLADNVEDIGVGYAYAPGSQWEHYWTVNFGRRDGPPDEADFVTYAPVVVGGGG